MLYYMKRTGELEFRIERRLYRQGKIVGGVYVGRGQEAIAVGSCIDLRQDDVVCPSHRDMGAFLIRGMSLRTIFAQRSEEHTSELQSHLNLVCRLLLEKKKQSSNARGDCIVL